MTKIVVPPNTSVVDLALNETGSLAGLPGILSQMPVEKRIGFDDMPQRNEDTGELGQTWTPDVAGEELELNTYEYNPKAREKRPYDTNLQALQAAIDWGNASVLPRVPLTYVDPNDPSNYVVREYTAGTTVVLERPEDLGFFVSFPYIFSGWFIGVDEVTAIVLDEATTVTGQKEVLVRPNLVQESRSAPWPDTPGAIATLPPGRFAVTRSQAVDLFTRQPSVFDPAFTSVNRNFDPSSTTRIIYAIVRSTEGIASDANGLSRVVFSFDISPIATGVGRVVPLSLWFHTNGRSPAEATKRFTRSDNPGVFTINNDISGLLHVQGQIGTLAKSRVEAMLEYSAGPVTPGFEPYLLCGIGSAYNATSSGYRMERFKAEDVTNEPVDYRFATDWVANDGDAEVSRVRLMRASVLGTPKPARVFVPEHEPFK